jgi:hypothetical protein
LVELRKGAVPMSDFELAVAQSVARAWLLERALHDEGDWVFRTSTDWCFADRIVDEEDHRVLFVGILNATPWDGEDVPVELLCDDEVVSMRVVKMPPGQSVVEWEIGLSQVATV